MSYETLRTDIQAIIVEHGQTATLTRQTETKDSMGDVTEITDTSYTIKFIMQDITKKDRQIHEMGLAIPGNVKAFFYDEYPASITGSVALEVRAGDMILDKKGNYWRIEEILGKRKRLTKNIFISAVLKQINLDDK